jgi:hypothetical protein
MRKALRLSAFGLLLGALTSCSFFDYSGMVGRKYALIYGVTNYTKTVVAGSSPNLLYPAADAQSMATTLGNAGYQIAHARWIDGTSQVWVQDLSAHLTPTVTGTIGSPQMSTGGAFSDPGGTGTGIADAPTKANIEADIQSLASVVGKNDTVVVYFSGHGTPPDPNASPRHEYFDPYESVIYFAAYTDYYAYPNNAVQDDELRPFLSALASNRKVLILDTCNSGGFIGNQAEVDWTPQAIAGQLAFVNPATLIAAIAAYATMQSSPTGLSPYGDAQVISAAGRDESSFETPSYQHGVMTYWLLEGLKGAADLNHDGHITVLEAFAYTKAGIDQNWNNAVPANATPFEPHVSGGPVDFVLF